ncbi:MAG TPA: translation factor GTPase family protein [Pseudonocardiaceae bacterium]|jgi:ribosomal protection tetracycline resistance protein|nr:translation factor GTPase family protein [Pseudonocardiaceae bacterium]
MALLNLGIVAHVDAGKTSLTERLLFDAGVIDRVGSVDGGDTQTDSMALERQRGITIRSAVVSFAIGGVTVNLIDTPGHPDFIAEVERVLSVLDGAVLVISAVEGVQAQTRVLLRALRRLRIPTLIFVNKIDRAGARHESVLRDIATKLTRAIAPATAPGELGTRSSHVTPDTSAWLDVLSERDDDLLAAYVADQRIPPHELRKRLADQTQRGEVHPVYFGSAITGAGVPELADAIATLLPSADGDVAAPASGTVFKVDRGAAGEKVAYVRMFAGTIHVRDRLPQGRITAIDSFDRGRVTSVAAGRIAKLWGLPDVRIGDTIGVPHQTGTDHHFAPPTLETVVECAPTDRGALHVALTQLAEQDPLINLRQDEIRQETSVSLYGEVQKEVIQATLAGEFGIDVTFRETTTICVERVAGVGEAVARIKAGHPFLATVGLRIEPGAPGSGVEFRLGVELGAMPYAFFKAVEDTVRETLTQGMHGWEVQDCVVTMTHSGYCPKQSHAHGTFDKSMSSTGYDFRYLTPLVVVDALRRAETRVYEPMHRFRVEAPADSLGMLVSTVVRLGGAPRTQSVQGDQCVLDGDLPAGAVRDLEQQLPGLTSGEGMLEATFDHYAPTRPPTPSRARTDHNPANRKEYLLHVVRRV